MTPAFKAWAATLLAVAVFAVIAISWLDRPIALFVHDIFGGQHDSAGVVRPPGLLIPLLSSSVFVVFGLPAIIGPQFSELETAVFLCTGNGFASEILKKQLKFFFWIT